jgi:hypothetical protein
MSTQTVFAQALLQPGQPCPDGLRTWNGSDPTLRLAVYRNNVVVSLVDALAATFPVVQALVGEEFFRAMAAVFVRAQPPSSRILAWYGAGLADFIAAFEPAAGLPYLADVARLEMARVRAYHAADVAAVPPEALQAALSQPERLAYLRLGLHPSLQVLASPYAVFSLWAAHQGTLALASVDPHHAETALVYRHAMQVESMACSPATGRFIQALLQGEGLLAAASADAALDLPTTLAYLIRQQLVTHIDFGD